MFNRLNRTDFYKTNIVEGKEEIDLVTFSVGDFKFNREKTFYKITEEDLLRPDLIAIKAYGDIVSMNYWYVILYINDIQDIWNDLQIGDILTIPAKKDIEDLIVANRNFRNND